MNRTQEAGGAGQKDGLCGFRRDNGLIGEMGFQRQAAGTVSFNQNIVCQSRQEMHGDGWGSKFIICSWCAYTETTVALQCGGQGGEGGGGEKRKMGRGTDMRGGGA